MPISATILLRSDKDGGDVLTEATFDDAVWAELKKDWLTWLNTGKPLGGAYRYTSILSSHPREMLITFATVKAIY